MSMEGKSCMVTGASSGIGMATALELARMSAVVTAVCRDEARGREVVQEIRSASGNQKVDLIVADLASQSSVRRLAEDFKSRHGQLHVLINNAGTYCTRRRVTIDGFETVFAVNYLARFLLANLLLDPLVQGAPARVIDVAGAYHARGRIDFDDLQGEKRYDAARANSQSKLANVLFTYELARRLDGSGVTANCLHPGAVATSLLQKDPDCPRFTRSLYLLFRPFLKSPRQGAETVLYLASSPDVQGVTGKYFVDSKETRSSKDSYDRAAAKRLWDESLRLTGLQSGRTLEEVKL